MASNWEAHYSKGVIGSRPAANTLPKGAIYFATDENKYYVGDGSGNAWTTFAGPFAGTGATTFTGDVSVPDEAYDATAWNASVEVPTKNAVRDKIETLAALAGATFTGDVIVPDEAYDATGWNGDLSVPTKNAVRDKIETLSAGSGKIAQVVNTQTGAVATGTTILPFDDTIPQNTEGDEYMTLAITPTSATNKLRIDVVFFGTPSVSDWITAALFQDSTANALAAMPMFHGTATAGTPIVFTHYMTSGTTSATTFKVRAGKNGAGTTTFNGQSGGRIFGGVFASSITITEIVP